ncbi:hypothetical protein M407DRAFT_240735 [Tulasnella calospora MUT 4182]|uniref:COX assembly mitochondrial protein n=1 Tax=Tulasnella calospora MUT 4182 TaxID=1051891 RepID=A0A0C3QMC9_9AGAM|nr:hypothetical protein M407DRAFT_240735 [Tulasnella calospora MUT 4182]
METLSRREEEALFKATKARALKECDVVVKEFANCASGRYFSVIWACKDKLKAMQACVYQYTNPDNMDQLRAEYIRLRRDKGVTLDMGPKENNSPYA